MARLLVIFVALTTLTMLLTIYRMYGHVTRIKNKPLQHGELLQVQNHLRMAKVHYNSSRVKSNMGNYVDEQRGGITRKRLAPVKSGLTSQLQNHLKGAKFHYNSSHVKVKGNMGNYADGQRGDITRKRLALVAFGLAARDRYRAPRRGRSVKVNIQIALESLGYNVSQKNRREAEVFWFKTGLPPKSTSLIPQGTKVNHIPGMVPLIYKRDLLTKSNSSSILPAFVLPREKEKFRSHANQHNDTLWVTKHTRHRGVKIATKEDILKARPFPEFLVQEFLPNPLLIDNRKFDIGVFALVTSISPLRVYIYYDDFLFKFCTAEYLPFDPLVTAKFVESHPITRMWELPSMLNTNFTKVKFVEALQTYINEKGFEGSKLKAEVRSSAVDVINLQEPAIAKLAEPHLKAHWVRNAFEFLRFDMVADTNLKTWVMEINMSPDTQTSSPTSLHIKLFQDVLASSLIMVGLGNASWSETKNDFMRYNSTVPEDEINVDNDLCESCGEVDCSKDWKCRTCKKCLRGEDEFHMKSAVLEHRRQTQENWIRVSPPPWKDQEAAKAWEPMTDKYYNNFSDSTKFMTLWYRRKCIIAEDWC